MSNKNVKTSFFPLYFMCRILGTIPLSRTSRNNYQCSFLASSYTILFIALLLSSCYVVVHYFHTAINSSEIPFSYYVEPILTCIISVTIKCNSLLKMKDVKNLLDEIYSLDISVIRTPVQFHDRSYNVNIVLSIMYPLLYLIIRMLRLIPKFDVGDVINFLLVDLAHITTISSEAQFIGLCYFLKQRFQLVNMKLQNTCPSGKARRLDINLQDSYWLKSEFQLPNRQFLTASELEMLRKGHIQLCEITEHLNGAYGAQLFLSVIMSFVQIPINMYVVAQTKDEDNYLYFIIMSIWCTTFILRLFITLKMCSSTVHEALRASTIVENMKHRNLHSEIKEELTLFSRHMANENVEFTACGFNMDMPVFTSVIAAGVTYLVIMIQL